MAGSYYSEPSSFFVAISLGFAIGDAAGPLWGGLLFETLGYSGIFLVQAGVSFCIMLLVLYFRKYEKLNPPSPPKNGRSLGYWQVMKQPVSRLD